MTFTHDILVILNGFNEVKKLIKKISKIIFWEAFLLKLHNCDFRKDSDQSNPTILNLS